MTLWDITDVNRPVAALIPDQTEPGGESLSRRANINLPDRQQLGWFVSGEKRENVILPKIHNKDATLE